MNDMYGKGILKGLSVSLKRFVDTYLDDLKWLGKRYRTDEGIAHRASKDGRGIFTVQYPEEKIPVPEEFRFVPFLVYDENEDGEKVMRCTSCGICSRVCPPQCIWIVRSTDPATGRPIPDPAEFYVDTDICMNCGLCAEYCPFDAIKMDHDYELASFGRNLFDKAKLAKLASYYESIRPVNAARENAARSAKEAARAAHTE
jgi:NADH-quinone oxidoreductase subunit I